MRPAGCKVMVSFVTRQANKIMIIPFKITIMMQYD